MAFRYVALSQAPSLFGADCQGLGLAKRARDHKETDACAARPTRLLHADRPAADLRNGDGSAKAGTSGTPRGGLTLEYFGRYRYRHNLRQSRICLLCRCFCARTCLWPAIFLGRMCLASVCNRRDAKLHFMAWGLWTRAPSNTSMGLCRRSCAARLIL